MAPESRSPGPCSPASPTAEQPDRGDGEQPGRRRLRHDRQRRVERRRRGLAGVLLALLASGCAIPVHYTHDAGQFCAMDAGTFCEVRERVTGWSWYEIISPCPKVRHISSHRTLYKATYDLSAAEPAQSKSAAVAVGDDVHRNFGGDHTMLSFARDRFGLPATVEVGDSDDPRLARFHPVDLSAAEAEPLRRLGFEWPRDVFVASYRWDGPDGRWYLAYGDQGLQVACPQAGIVRRRALAGNYSPIWDPAGGWVAVVGTDSIHWELPTSVTVWDYARDGVRTYSLRPRD